MDSFFSLFDPSDGHQNKSKKKHQVKEQDNVKKKVDPPRGRRRGRKAQGKSETLPEESSFLCEPALSTEVLVKDGSYIDCYIEVNVKDEAKPDSKPKRRNSGRKNRRWKRSPAKEGEPTDSTTWNNMSLIPKVCADVGKNVNDLNDYKKNKRKPFEEEAVHNVIDKLEKVILKDDMYLAGDFNTEDLDNETWYSSDDFEESLDDTTSDCDGSGDEAYGSLPPEPRFGNVEYKLQLVSPGERRFQHLVTQLKWRLRSGGGSAVYLLGVRDCGALRGLRARALRGSLHTLRRMAAALNATLAHVSARRVAPHRAVAEVYVRKLADTQQSVELRVAVMGANEAGKSTLIGVLTQGELDNGRGSARLNMFRHLHEVRSGMTSSLSHEILGFDAQGNVVNYGCSELMTAERIGERSSKLVSFLDLAGHSKYQRTTLHGLTGYSPHCAMLLISATAGITRITEEHIGLLLALDMPFFTVVSKCELAPAAVTPLLDRLAEILEHANKKPLLITDENLARNCVGPQKLILDTIDGIDSIEEKDEPQLEQVPVFPVSCVKGAGLNALHAYLLALQPPTEPPTPPDHETCEFQIDEIFHVGDSAGPVVGGLLARGELYEGDNLIIGPLDTGEFVEISVKTIYRNRVPCGVVKAGQSASLGLDRRLPGLRPGMVLLAVPEKYGEAHERPTFGGCLPGKCRRNGITMLQNQPKHKKDKNKNLYQVIAAVENSLTKPQENIKKNIYTSDSEDNREISKERQEVTRSKKELQEVTRNKKGFQEVTRNKEYQEITRGNEEYQEVTRNKKELQEVTRNKEYQEFTRGNEELQEVTRNKDYQEFTRSKEEFQEVRRNKEGFKEVTRSKEEYRGVVAEKEEFRVENECECDCRDQVFLEDPNDPRGCIYFQATIHVLRHSTAISPGFQCTVHVGNVRQTAIVEGIMSATGSLRCGECAPVVFRFLRCPEHLVRHRRLLLAAGLGTRAIGRITQIFPYIP